MADSDGVCQWACGNVSSVLDGTATEDNLPSNATSSYQSELFLRNRFAAFGFSSRSNR